MARGESKYSASAIRDAIERLHATGLAGWERRWLAEIERVVDGVHPSDLVTLSAREAEILSRLQQLHPRT